MDFTAANLKARCEQGREVGEPTSMYLSVTGEPYVVIGMQSNGVPATPGTVDEGAEREWAFDVETAYFQALACFETYAHDRPGKLYWRWEPTFERRADSKSLPMICWFYMRCLISDKPLIAKDDPRVKSYWDGMAAKAAFVSA
jgi:hypothetical protein